MKIFIYKGSGIMSVNLLLIMGLIIMFLGSSIIFESFDLKKIEKEEE